MFFLFFFFYYKLCIYISNVLSSLQFLYSLGAMTVGILQVILQLYKVNPF